VTLLDFKEAIREGKTLDVKLEEPKPDTVYTLSYTSGTTGMPKGTMITH
jgi:long-chain acyl-CoA synthetase